MVAARSNQLKEPIDIPEGQVDPATKVEPLLNPGDAVFFENRTWHAGAANLTDRIRKAVMVGYSYDWITPTDYRQQAPELVEKLSPMERYLIGEPVDNNPNFDFTGGANPIADWCTDNGYRLSAPDNEQGSREPPLASQVSPACKRTLRKNQ